MREAFARVFYACDWTWRFQLPGRAAGGPGASQGRRQQHLSDVFPGPRSEAQAMAASDDAPPPSPRTSALAREAPGRSRQNLAGRQLHIIFLHRESLESIAGWNGFLRRSQGPLVVHSSGPP